MKFKESLLKTLYYQVFKMSKESKINLCGSVYEADIPSIIQHVIMETNVRGKKVGSSEIVFKKDRKIVRVILTGYGGYYSYSGCQRIVEELER